MTPMTTTLAFIGTEETGDPIVRNADAETTTLSTSRQFLSIIKRSRSRRKKEGSVSSKEIRRRLGLGK